MKPGLTELKEKHIALLCLYSSLLEQVFYGSWKCSSTVLISEGDAVSDGVRTRHKGNDQVNQCFPCIFNIHNFIPCNYIHILRLVFSFTPNHWTFCGFVLHIFCFLQSTKLLHVQNKIIDGPVQIWMLGISEYSTVKIMPPS